MEILASLTVCIGLIGLVGLATLQGFPVLLAGMKDSLPYVPAIAISCWNLFLVRQNGSVKVQQVVRIVPSLYSLVTFYWSVAAYLA